MEQGLQLMLPLVLLIFIMYFLMIRPQKKRERETAAMRNAVKAGDEIVTIGGIHGVITKVRDEYLTIQIGSDKTKLEIARWAVNKVLASDSSSAKKQEEDAPAAEPKRQRPKKIQKEAAPVAPVEAEAPVTEEAPAEPPAEEVDEPVVAEEAEAAEEETQDA